MQSYAKLDKPMLTGKPEQTNATLCELLRSNADFKNAN